MKRWIVFDMGNVLLHFDHMIACRGIESRFGVDANTAYTRIWGGGIASRFEVGEINTQEFVTQCESALGVTLHESAFCASWAQIFHAVPAMDALVATLAGRANLCLASNTDPLHFGHAMQKFGILGYFNHRVLSYEVGASKPAAAFYRAVLAEIQPTSQPIFVDDLEANVVAAAQVGFHSILFHSADRLARDLATIDSNLVTRANTDAEQA